MNEIDGENYAKDRDETGDSQPGNLFTDFTRSPTVLDCWTMLCLLDSPTVRQ